MTVYLVMSVGRMDMYREIVGVYSSEDRAKESHPADDWKVTAGVLWADSKRLEVHEWEVDSTEHLE